MRLFLSAPVTQTQVKNSISLLRTAKISVDGGALLLNGAEDTAGVILLKIDSESGEAIRILAKAGILASA